MKILVTGTPGIGKTTLSNGLASVFGAEHIDISQFIIESKNYEKFNDRFESYEFDENAVGRELRKHLKGKKNFIVDTHSPSVARKIKFDKILILTIKSDIIYQRLKQRGYPENKIRENVHCEIFGVIEDECLEYFDEEKILKMECTDMNLDELLSNVLRELNTVI